LKQQQSRVLTPCVNEMMGRSGCPATAKDSKTESDVARKKSLAAVSTRQQLSSFFSPSLHFL
jgi:hypothetical protein